MHQVDPTVWNRIAETQELRTEFARRVFPMEPDAQAAELALLSARLEAEGVRPPEVRAAYALAMPLLWENRAIQAFVKENPGLAPGLPDVADVTEAVAISSMEFPMTIEQQAQLARLLRIPPE